MKTKGSADIPVRHIVGCPVTDLSAVASAKEEAEARETDKALKEILESIGV